MAVQIPIVSDIYNWFVITDNNINLNTQREERRTDALFRQSTSLPTKTAYMPIATIHALSEWVVNSPRKLALGAIDFAGSLLSDPIATITSIPGAMMDASDEIILGGKMMASGRIAEGLHRSMDGATVQFVALLGGRMFIKGVLKAAPEAARLSNEGLTRFQNLRPQNLQRGAAMEEGKPVSTLTELPKDPLRLALERDDAPLLIRNAALRQFVEHPELINSTHIPGLLRIARAEICGTTPYQQLRAIEALGKAQTPVDITVAQTLMDLADKTTHPNIHMAACESLCSIARSHHAAPEVYARLAVWDTRIRGDHIYPGSNDIHTAAYNRLNQMSALEMQEAAPILADRLLSDSFVGDWFKPSAKRYFLEWEFERVFNALSRMGSSAKVSAPILREIAQSSDPWKCSQARTTLVNIGEPLEVPSFAPWTAQPIGRNYVMHVPESGIREFIVGRGDTSDIPINNRSVSTQHAELEINAFYRTVSVRDLGSRNGTTVEIGNRPPTPVTSSGLTIEMKKATRITITLGGTHGTQLTLDFTIPTELIY